MTAGIVSTFKWDLPFCGLRHRWHRSWIVHWNDRSPCQPEKETFAYITIAISINNQSKYLVLCQGYTSCWQIYSSHSLAPMLRSLFARVSKLHIKLWHHVFPALPHWQCVLAVYSHWQLDANCIPNGCCLLLATHKADLNDTTCVMKLLESQMSNEKMLH